MVQQISEKYFGNLVVIAGLVRCLGRLPYNFPFGYTLAEKCLQHDNLSMREAAVTYLESKGGKDAIKILSTHRETAVWLADYINHVIRDLQK